MYEIDEDACTGCGLCVERCPTGALSISGNVAKIDRDLCNSCGACRDECPQAAIYEYEVLPAPRQGVGAPARSTSRVPGPAVRPKVPALTPREKAVAVAALLPALSRLLIKLAGYVSPRGGGNRLARSGVVEPKVSRAGSGAGRHRWHGGRG
ncbi:MAG: 4Fe-4S binding protein [Actinobacteria bacterium]|nr:4Fe-4S binding protein [Actinomycetota bacterium]